MTAVQTLDFKPPAFTDDVYDLAASRGLKLGQIGKTVCGLVMPCTAVGPNGKDWVTCPNCLTRGEVT